MPTHAASDEDLLLSDDPNDFGAFYDRHVDLLLGWFQRRVRNADVAADLTAETFASALAARKRFRRGPVPAAGWLFGIAQHKLADYFRRGTSDDRMCRRLGLSLPRMLDQQDREMIELLAEDTATSLVDTLPADQRDAVRAYVLEDAAYEDIAAASDTSEATVRKRVSRGLGSLRRKMGAPR